MSYVDPNLLAFLLLRLIQSTDSYEELDSLFLIYSSLTLPKDWDDIIYHSFHEQKSLLNQRHLVERLREAGL